MRLLLRDEASPWSFAGSPDITGVEISNTDEALELVTGLGAYAYAALQQLNMAQITCSPATLQGTIQQWKAEEAMRLQQALLTKLPESDKPFQFVPEERDGIDSRLHGTAAALLARVIETQNIAYEKPFATAPPL